EDFVLLVIGLSWLAKTAVNKELNLIARTPLNWPILLYAATTLAATLLGSLTGTINSWSGYFHVLKYVEYFVIYYMAVNNLRDREHGWRLVGAAFIPPAIVSGSDSRLPRDRAPQHTASVGRGAGPVGARDLARADLRGPQIREGPGDLYLQGGKGLRHGAARQGRLRPLHLGAPSLLQV